MKAPETKAQFHDVYEDLKKRFETMELELTVRDPDQDLEGYVVVWNTKICKDGPFDRDGKGSGKGGTRILRDLEIEDIKRLARSMAEKNAAAGLRLGGAKSGLRYDSNAPDYEEKYRRFVKLVQNSGILVEDGGIFGGFGYDVGGKPPLNAQWACDELGTLGSFAGKPVGMGGTDYDKEGIAGLGVAVAARTVFENRGKAIDDVTFTVQGIGAMGGAVVKYFANYGAKLRAISDPRFGGTWVFENFASDKLVDTIFNQQDSNVNECLASEGRLLSDDTEIALYQDVDVVFPCALEDAITKKNADRIVAPYVCEGANNPTTAEAHDILFAKGIVVIPDIIANPGGIISAYVELSSDVSPAENVKTRAKVDQAKAMTEDRVAANTLELLGYVDTLGVRPDKVGDYMAWRNIFYGIPTQKNGE